MVREWAKRNLEGDPIIWSVVFALAAFGILVVYSATGSLAYKMMSGNTEHYLFKHSMLVIFSITVMWIAHKVDYRYYSRIAQVALWIAVGLMIITWKFGANLNSATRWIYIPLINQSFQPSDLAKLALIASLASILSKKQNKIESFRSALVPMLLMCGLVCGMIALTNFSTALLLFFTCMLLMFIGRVPVKFLFLFMSIGALAGTLALFTGQRGGTVVSRVTSYWEGAETELPFQAMQSNIAIATGGIVGKGWGQSEQRNFLPHSYSDFIYAIIIEEYGIVGGFTVLFLYLVLLYRGMRAVSISKRAFGGLLSAGLSFALVLQAMVNMAVAVGAIPITGLPLPLISWGGTSLLFTGISLGIILSVSKGEPEDYQQRKENTINKLKAA